jgi:hypothetical protein
MLDIKAGNVNVNVTAGKVGVKTGKVNVKAVC